MIRVFMFDSINGQKPLYLVNTPEFGMPTPLEYKDYRFMLQTYYHLRGNENDVLHITVFDADNEVFQDRKLTLREWMDENED